MTAKTTKTTKTTIRNIKVVIAVAYIIIGIAVSFVAAFAGVSMWFSGDFLVGISVTSINWWIRKFLYLVLFIIVLVGGSLAGKGYRYLKRRRRK